MDPRRNRQRTTRTKRREKKNWTTVGGGAKNTAYPKPSAACACAKVAAEFKKKGDWCEKHDRANSQCFICDASLGEKYAARYEAKYGKKPPVPEENRAKAEDKK